MRRSFNLLVESCTGRQLAIINYNFLVFFPYPSLTDVVEMVRGSLARTLFKFGSILCVDMILAVH